MLPNRQGLYHAYPAGIRLDETPKNRLTQVVIQYRLFEELVHGTWIDCSQESLEITGYHCVERKDGSANEPMIRALKAAFGWDGLDVL